MNLRGTIDAYIQKNGIAFHDIGNTCIPHRPIRRGTKTRTLCDLAFFSKIREELADLFDDWTLDKKSGGQVCRD